MAGLVASVRRISREQGRKETSVYAPINQTHIRCVLYLGPRMGLSPSPKYSAMGEADLDSMPSWTQPRGEGAMRGGGGAVST